MKAAHAFTAVVAFALAIAASLGSRESVAHADAKASFPAGNGARYAFDSPLAQAEMTLSIVESTSDRVVVELYFERASLLAAGMWQQFVLRASEGPAPTVEEGYLLTADGRAPERIPREMLHGLEDASVSDFLFATRAELDRYKLGEEKVVVPASAAPLSCTKYERTTGKKVVTFWLSDEARPIGLVQLRSRGPRASDNYALALTSLLTNAGRKIDPAKAVPLSADTRDMLSTKLR